MTKDKVYTDQELLAYMRNGNQLAFESIFNKYAEDLFIYAHKKLNNKEESQDIVQDIFIYLFKNKEQLQDIQNLASYLYKAVLNKIFDLYKHKYVVNEYANTHSDEFKGQNYYVGTDFLIREKELKMLIDSTIDKMPDRMREVFVLKKFEHLSTKQIAERLNLSELTVSTHLKKATRLLKSNIEEFLILFLLFLKN